MTSADFRVKFFALKAAVSFEGALGTEYQLYMMKGLMASVSSCRDPNTWKLSQLFQWNNSLTLEGENKSYLNEWWQIIKEPYHFDYWWPIVQWAVDQMLKNSKLAEEITNSVRDNLIRILVSYFSRENLCLPSHEPN
jgi:hypothetical protein